MTDTVLDRVAAALETSLAFDPNVMTAPVALLWPDEHSEFAAAIPRLQERVRIIRFGPIDAGASQGPAYWLRCAIKGTVELDGAPDGVPVVYLPGVSRDRLRALDHLSDELAPLGALQHQCQWFAHPNGKDWSVRSLLSNKERGLGLDVSNDAGTGEALVASGRCSTSPSTGSGRSTSMPPSSTPCSTPIRSASC